MKKVMYGLILLLVVVSGLVFANHQMKNDAPEKSTPKPLCAADQDAAMKEWLATPAGIQFKDWEASPEGIKVLAGAAKINKLAGASANIEAVVTSLSLPPGSRLGFGVMARIDGDDYILTFWSLQPNELQDLHSLKVNDKIMIRSHGVSYAPKYAYPIITGDYAERDGKVIYKRIPGKGGC